LELGFIRFSLNDDPYDEIAIVYYEINTFKIIGEKCVPTLQGIEHRFCRQLLSNKYEPKIPHTSNGNAKATAGCFPPDPIRTPTGTCCGTEEAHQLRQERGLHLGD